MAGLGRTGAGMAAVALLSSVATLSGAAPVAAHTSLTAAPSPLDWLTAWSFDPLPWLGVMGAAVAYLLCALYVNRRHPGTPVARWRVAAFLLGLGTILIALESPVDTFADQLLAVHMQQHLLLAMVAPPLLALGAPGTLLLRASRPDLRRRVLLPLLRARPVRVLTSASVTSARA